MENKPVFGTYEWASYNVNCINGCSSNCKYCYSKTNAIKRGIKTKENWAQEVVNQKAVDKKYYEKNGTIMAFTQHDISKSNIDACLIVLKKLLKAGNKVLIVSKPHLYCIMKLCKELNIYKDNMLFRFTIGSADNEVLKFWEPNAPDFKERFASLQRAFYLGFQTSVSCEPMLDGEINKVVELVKPYTTDAIWLGKMNFAEDRLRINGELEAIEKAKELMKLQSDDFIKNLYETYKDDPQVKWKDSIKQIVGLERFTEAGLDK